MRMWIVLFGVFVVVGLLFCLMVGVVEVLVQIVMVIYDYLECFIEIWEEKVLVLSCVSNDYLVIFKIYIEKCGVKMLFVGQYLDVVIIDVDCVGLFELWCGLRLSEVWIIKDIYLLCINFSFKLFDVQGKVICEGMCMLCDFGFFISDMVVVRDDSLCYEK